MAIVSHLHHLFSAETCQSSIHTLRWKERPLQCPRCQSHNVGLWGTYHAQPGLQRYRCKEKDRKCRRLSTSPCNGAVGQGDRILSCSGEYHQQVVLVETT
jgi:transposase-like protein